MLKSSPWLIRTLLTHSGSNHRNFLKLIAKDLIQETVKRWHLRDRRSVHPHINTTSTYLFGRKPKPARKKPSFVWGFKGSFLFRKKYEALKKTDFYLPPKSSATFTSTLSVNEHELVENSDPKYGSYGFPAPANAEAISSLSPIQIFNRLAALFHPHHHILELYLCGIRNSVLVKISSDESIGKKP
ncbi:hypothetical protein TNCV_4400631 [Trichonephila clavipes]|nr:hypothetical protein TNCV_4400631 [Trichonephila clavipes]